jgi:hypothetical protein
VHQADPQTRALLPEQEPATHFSADECRPCRAVATTKLPGSDERSATSPRALWADANDYASHGHARPCITRKRGSTHCSTRSSAPLTHQRTSARAEEPSQITRAKGLVRGSAHCSTRSVAPLTHPCTSAQSLEPKSSRKSHEPKSSCAAARTAAHAV